MTHTPLALRVLEAYGGATLWTQASEMTAEFSLSGIGLMLKRRPKLEHAILEMDIQHQYIKITPIGNDLGYSGVLDGDTVHIENSEGIIKRERYNARMYFPYGRRLFYWDDLDMTYVAGYLLWNILAFPALLTRDDIHWSEKEPFVLTAEFPPTFHTHCRVQQFHIDPDTLFIQQQTYVPEVVSGSMHVVQNMVDYDTNGEMPFPTTTTFTFGKSLEAGAHQKMFAELNVHAMHIK